MTSESRLTALAQAIGLDVKALLARAAYPWTEVRLSSTYSNATASGTDIATMFTPTKGKRYQFECRLLVLADAATTGIQLSLAGPLSGVNRASVRTAVASSATADSLSYLGLNAFSAATGSATIVTQARIDAMVDLSTTSSVEPFKVQGLAKPTLNTGSFQAFPGSVFRWRELA